MRITLALSGERELSSLADHFPGVGLLRGEYIFRRLHQYVTVDAAADYLTDYLSDVARTFNGHPVWYRTTEMEVDEVRVLDGCDDPGLRDSIGMLGTRGIRRAQKYPGTFDKELLAFRKAASAYSNLGIVFPYVATAEELEWALSRLRGLGIDTPVSCMAEIPAAIVCLDSFLDLGITRVLVGANDLWGLTMGAERGCGRYPKLTGAMRRMLEMARTTTAKRGVEVAIAGFLDPSLLDFADSIGFDEATVHYAQLPELLGQEFRALPELGLMKEIKEWTWEARRALGERFAST